MLLAQYHDPGPPDFLEGFENVKILTQIVTYLTDVTLKIWQGHSYETNW